MVKKKLKTLNMVALIVSVLPVLTLIPIFLKITLSNGVRFIWTGANIVFALSSMLLSVICIRHKGNCSTVNIISMVISTLWILMMIGIVVLALFINFVQ